MGKKSFLITGLLVALLAWVLVGCGGKDETPAAENTSQTAALVPDSVVQHEEDAAQIDPIAEVPAVVEEAQEPAAEHPGSVEPAAVEEEVSAPAQTAEASIPTPVPGDGIFSLQLGSYTVAKFAEEKAAELRKLGYPGTVEEAEVGGQLYHRVFIRGLADRPSAEKLGEDLHERLGLSYLIRRK